MLCDGGAVSRALAGLASALALAACSGGGGPRMYVPRDLPRTANPSAVVAAEMAFARAAQDKGQWTAFADYAADDAVMFVPEPVKAKTWLKGRANPGQAVAWQPHEVWSSCDGSLAVTKGAWQRPDGSIGYFTTVWQRQERSGEYKWVMDQGDTVETALVPPEFVITHVAECASQSNPASAAGDYESWLDGQGFFQKADATQSQISAAKDGTLAWAYDYAAGGERRVRVATKQAGQWVEVLDVTVLGEGD